MSESIVKELKPKSCVLCCSPIDNEWRLGPKYQLDDLVVHYFCLLFASKLIENGQSKEDGILGFLENDIRKEVKRAKKLKCVFCKKKGAASGCCIAKCTVAYHYPCGLENNILSQFKSPQFE